MQRLIEMICIECELRPRHKRYHRCREGMTWTWSLTSRKGLFKRVQIYRQRTKDK
jgi:hypothetical protein